ncbi:MAG: hypothetical protein N2746_12590 [Deltaproteobacteria bacterium]|nr:hypothetical protein [Deltaproteobacteria bacterium]
MKVSSQAFNWFMQRITAIIIAIGLIVHFVVLHFLIERPITVHKVAERLQSFWWVLFDSILLVAVVYHALYGCYNIVNDFRPSERMKGFLVIFLWVLGLGAVVIGIANLLPFTKSM